MNKQTILIVDDQKTTHIFLKAMLSSEYHLKFALDAQEAIDILKENSVNLVLLDIQMPELSGLELLESLMIDTALNIIPIIIITGEASEEREQQAKKLGAMGFVSKDNLLSETGKSTLDGLIKKNIKKSASKPHQEADFRNVSRLIIKSLMNDAKKQDFFFAARKLGLNIMKHFEVEYISYWSIQHRKPSMLLSLGETQPEEFGPDEIIKERAFKELYFKRTPYLTNNAGSQKKGIFANVAMNVGLSSEIGIPLFKISRQYLIKEGVNVPKNTPLYGFIILKRNHVFTTKEYKILTNVFAYSGSILWDLFKNMFND